MQSDAKTVEEYLSELDPTRREAISAVRTVILDNLPHGYDDVMQYGMISYIVPLSVIPDTYNGQPLMYIALASKSTTCPSTSPPSTPTNRCRTGSSSAISPPAKSSTWANHAFVSASSKPAPRPGRRGHRPHTSRQIRRRDQGLQISLEPQIAYSQGNFASIWDKRREAA